MLKFISFTVNLQGHRACYSQRVALEPVSLGLNLVLCLLYTLQNTVLALEGLKVFVHMK